MLRRRGQGVYTVPKSEGHVGQLPKITPAARRRALRLWARSTAPELVLRRADETEVLPGEGPPRRRQYSRRPGGVSFLGPYIRGETA